MSEDNSLLDLTSFEGKVFEYQYTDTKLFFDNDRRKAQEFDWMFPGAHFVVEWSKHTAQYDIQVIFPLTANWKYNHYLIFLYSWEAKKLYITGYHSHTVYPPVWDRSFSFGPDYTDYVAIQKYLQPFLQKLNLEQFEIDESYEGKVVNATKETPEEVRKLIAEGKSYTVISMWADSFFEKCKVEKATKMKG